MRGLLRLVWLVALLAVGSLAGCSQGTLAGSGTGDVPSDDQFRLGGPGGSGGDAPAGQQ